MAIRGLFSSHSAIVGDRRAGDFAGRVLMNGFGGTVPMLALSAGMPKDSVTTTEYSWVDDTHISGAAKATVAATAVATSITVDDSNIWIPNSILLHELSDERMLVTAVTGNVVTVIRGFTGTTASAISVGDRLQYIATAFPEASEGAKPVMQVGESRTNYVQIFKGAWGVSGTAAAIEYRTGNKVAESSEKAMGYLMESIERAFMFGRPYVTTYDNKPMRLSGGIQHAIKTYGGIVKIAADNGVAGRLNLRTILNFLRTIFDRQVKGLSNERIAYTSTFVLELLQQMLMDIGEFKMTSEDTKFGIEVTKIKGIGGELSLMTHPFFTESELLQRELWVMHPGLIRRKELRGLQILKYADQLQPNALDAKTGHLRIEMGFEIRGERTMGILSNITTAGGLGALPST